MGIIYEIKNLKNNKSYVGRTVRSFEERCLNEHYNKLIKDKHENSHLQNAWNKYEESDFKFITLVVINDKDLIKAEQYWIDKLNAYEDGYNQEKYADKSMNIGEDHHCWTGGMVEISCNYCGKKFKAHKNKVSRRNHCSTSCSNKNNLSVEMIDKKCKNCKSKFTVLPKRKNSAKFCSNGCQVSYNNRGSKNEKSKLCEDDVILIKKLLKNRELNYKEIAEKFNVSKPSVGHISRGETWSHITI